MLLNVDKCEVMYIGKNYFNCNRPKKQEGRMVSQICINIKTLKGFKKHKEKVLNTKALSYSEKPLKPALLEGVMVCGRTKMFFFFLFSISLQRSVLD